MFSTYYNAICFDLIKESEIFRIKTHGFSATCVLGKPLFLKDKKVYFGDKVLSTFISPPWFEFTPDEQKVFVFDEELYTMKIFYLNDLEKLEERT